MQEPYRALACHGLNILLADYVVHAHRVRMFRWNMERVHANILGGLMDKLLQNAQTQSDHAALRISELGGVPGGSLPRLLAITSFAETGPVHVRGMLEQFTDDYESLSDRLVRLTQFARQEGDTTTIQVAERQNDIFRICQADVRQWLA